MATETVTCRRCGGHAEAQRHGDTTVVPAGWRRVVGMIAGPGMRITEDMAAYEPADGYWLCPAHTRPVT